MKLSYEKKTGSLARSVGIAASATTHIVIILQYHWSHLLTFLSLATDTLKAAVVLGAIGSQCGVSNECASAQVFFLFLLSPYHLSIGVP